MIRKGTKKVIPYNNDYEPTKIAKGDKVIFDYEKKTASGKEVSIVSEYKPKPYLEINGEQLQNTDKVPVLSVEGIGLKYNQLLNFTFTTHREYNFTVTNLNNYITIIGSNTIGRDPNLYVDFKSIKTISGHKYIYLNSSNNFASYIYGSMSPGIIGANGTIFTPGTGTLKLTIRPNPVPTTTINYNESFYIQIADLTDMFGAGNEPTTLEQFYATRQGKLYKSYVEYGYHILGAGEYLSNQLVGSNTISNLSGVSFSNNLFTFTEDVNNKTLLFINGLTVGEKYLISNNFSNEIFGAGKMRIYDNSGDLLYSPSGLFTARHTSIIILTISNSYTIPRGTQFYIALSKLTELGLQDLTLDQLKAQRPDLFVPQPYHTTEKRIGIIFNDGSVDRLDKPLYAVNDIKDEYKTNGVVNRKLDLLLLPSEYQEVEYIESTEKQYIDTGVVNTKDINFDIEFLLTKQNSVLFYGTRSTSFGDKSLLQEGSGNIAFQNVSQRYYSNQPLLRTKAVLNGNNITFTNSEGSVIRNITTTFNGNDLNIFLFAANVNGTPYLFTNNEVKIYYCKIYDSNVLVRNFIPCYRKSDNIIGMYDTVSKTFFTNQGTGTFLKGADINNLHILPQPIIELREPIAESHFDTINSIVNEDFTSDEVDTPSPSYPREIEHTSKFKWNDLELPLDLYNGDKIIVDKKQNKVMLYKVNDTYVFTGQESWIGLGSEHNNNFYNTTILSNAKFEHDIYVACDILKGQVSGGADDNYKDSIWLQSNSQYTRLYINIAQDNVDVDEIGRILKDHKVVYPLAQPQWIDITETHSQLLHDLTPNTTQEFSVDNGQVKVSYYKAKE